MNAMRDRFSARAAEILLKDPLGLDADLMPHGDHVIAGVPMDQSFLATAKPAAVLVPVVERAGGLTVLLTERSAALARHAGQVAFPGGRLEPGEDALQAALREAQEEIALGAEMVEPLGYLRPYFSGTGYRVQPVVGLVRDPGALQADPNEVARIFEMPLSVMLDLANYKSSTIFWKGRERRFYVLDYPEAYIWGVTAGIMRSFAELY